MSEQALVYGGELPEPTTVLVDGPRVPIVRTVRRESDVRTALCRGLAEYLSQQTAVAEGGREVRIRAAYANWPSQEWVARYPAVLVRLDGRGRYDASAFTPSVPIDPAEAARLPPGLLLVKASEYVAPIRITVKCVDTAQRAEIFDLIQQAMTPYDFAYGVRLDLPFYFGERAVYSLLEDEYLDDAESVQADRRDGALHCTGVIPVIRILRRPLGLPITIRSVVGPAAVVPVP